MNKRSLIVIGAFVVLVAALQPGHDAIGAAKNRAAVVVRTGDGSPHRFCVFFDEPSISGLDLLDRAGVTYVAEKSAVGSAICNIDGTGCRTPSQECFCRFPTFWGYWTRDADDESWTFGSVGANDREVRDGSMDGWSWGKDGKPAPPDVTLDDACASGPSTASPAGTTSAAARPSARATSGSNVLGFVGFALLFVLLAGVALVLRRRRGRPSGP